MASITCGNCGGTHYSVSEVKGCYIAHGKLSHRAATNPEDNFHTRVIQRELNNSGNVRADYIRDGYGDPSVDAGAVAVADDGQNDDYWINQHQDDSARRVDPNRMNKDSAPSFFRQGGSGPVAEEDRVYLNVPYAEKDDAKARFGAKWNASKKQWWVKKSADFDEMPQHWYLGTGMGSTESLNDKLARTANASGVNHELVEPGLFQSPNGSIYLAYMSQYIDAMLAKRLMTEATPDISAWSPEAGRSEAKIPWTKGSRRDYLQLREAWRVPKDKAAEFGRAFGFCMRCGRVLENPDSIEAGIGPKCATYF